MFCVNALVTGSGDEILATEVSILMVGPSRCKGTQYFQFVSDYRIVRRWLLSSFCDETFLNSDEAWIHQKYIPAVPLTALEVDNCKHGTIHFAGVEKDTLTLGAQMDPPAELESAEATHSSSPHIDFRESNAIAQ